ncbi:MAG TPA: undecaprenyldiphospho-muramoylpentapeptide beta-N-acetylglucosaminyltransferase [Rhizomicrobium sp.]|jgi:UDP-N-acetylglucosamine--N-acetylmuramyl-(pentapeptide) pyrophosphoryl-undecaprenol N-acetylglucosamine transferase|nr:undecaprenyldiphospho-muramoylpentapeptide beta-N-acetylglucosaminyltransferase [Rhizomicrobium sp.]
MSPIVLSAGGTGGHLFPAQALAGELLRRGRRIVVMTDRRGRHYDSVFPGARIEQVPSATFVGSLVSRAFAPLRIVAGIVVSFFKLRRIKPSAVVGFGGYPSLPVLAAALMEGLPTAIHEQNAVLGRVNRQFADRVKAVAASLPIARFAPRDTSRIVYTGNPVRPEAVKHAAAAYAAPREGETIRLLIFGGSQGARALSELVPAAIASLAADLRTRLDVVQQCRPEDLEAVRAAYSAAQVKAELAAFFDDLPARMAAAHLVIARSGASTVSELAVIGRPAILIPFPFATDDHQTANAAVFADAGAAWLVPQRDLSAPALARLLDTILRSPDELQRRAAAALSLARPDAASRLADLVEAIAGRAAA